MIHILLFIIAAATTPGGSSIFIDDRTITGIVVSETGEPLIFANIVAYDSHNKLLTGTQTDLDGQFSIITPLDCKWLEASYTGFESTRIAVNDSSYYSFTLKGGTVLTSVIIADHRVPLVEFDNTTAGGIKPARHLPITNLSSISATTAGLSAIDGGDVSVKGTRATKSSYYLDGIRSSTTTEVTSDEIRSITSDKVEAAKEHPAKIQNNLQSGLLTAGEINDFGKWTLWNDKSQDELTTYRTLWKMYPSRRYAVMLQNENGMPVVGQSVYLSDDKEQIIWETKTDNTGKAELWANMFEKTIKEGNELTITTKVNNKKYSLSSVKTFEEGVNHMTIKKDCALSKVVEAVFVIDATGSMDDELKYLQAELMDVIQKVKDNHQDLVLNLGCVFYRDHGDAYVTRTSELSDDISRAMSFIQSQLADGGGDQPEALDEALDNAVNKMNWTEDARTKLLFIVADAPPHQTDENLVKVNQATREAAKKGIKIIPLAASGIDKSTEYLMRSMALCTNGTYVFLTNHSGIGNPHIEPTTDKYEYEKLNNLLIRLFDQNCSAVDCTPARNRNGRNASDTMEIDSLQLSAPDTLHGELIEDNEAKVEEVICKYYPNPTSGLLNIEMKSQIQDLFLCDISGKLLQKIESHQEQKFQIDISEYPNGMYGLLYFDSGQRARCGMIVLVK